MSIRKSLKNTASRFMHLSAIPAGPKIAAEKDKTAEEKAAQEKSEKEAADKKKTDDEAAAAAGKNGGGETDDGEEDDDDEDGDEEEVKKAQAAGHAPALAAASRVERRRCSAIFASEHAVGRLPLACELAFGSDMKASAAIRILSASPSENAANPLATALASMERHDIGVDRSGKPGSESPDDALVAHATAISKKQ